MDLPKETLIGMYRTMLTIRRFEETANQVFANGLVPGFLHSSVGEEATAAGACANLRADDYIASNHRGHGHCIAKGADVKRMMAELMGRRTGYCKGKGGSMHIADPDLGILGANGIVGGGLPIASGAAFAAQFRGGDQVVICFFGDGASNEGSFHEALNLAGLWKLPVVFLCENNGYAELTHQRYHMAISDVSVRAAGYGMPGLIVDGTDVIAVYEATREAVTRARQGDGPTLLEAKTYRWRGHYEGDPQTYRSKAEVEEWMQRDCIAGLRRRLLEAGLATADELDAIHAAVEQTVAEAVQFAQQSPLPDPEETLSDVYA